MSAQDDAIKRLKEIHERVKGRPPAPPRPRPKVRAHVEIRASLIPFTAKAVRLARMSRNEHELLVARHLIDMARRGLDALERSLGEPLGIDFKATKAGLCPVCGLGIGVGEWIRYSAPGLAAHLDCCAEETRK